MRGRSDVFTNPYLPYLLNLLIFTLQSCNMQLTDEPEKRCYPLGDHLYCRSCHIRQGEKLGYTSSESVRCETSILIIGSNNQIPDMRILIFTNCLELLEEVLARFVSSFIFVIDYLIWFRNSWKNSGFIGSKFVVGSGEQ